MNKYFLLIAVLIFGAANLFAQKTFLLKEASKAFDVKITVAACEEDICEGKATVFLMKKNQTRAFQTIQMPNIYLELGGDQKPTANLIELYGMNNSGVIFDDFNFDGAEDLAFRNGNEGGYGGPSYDVLLFTKTTGKFTKNNGINQIGKRKSGNVRG